VNWDVALERANSVATLVQTLQSIQAGIQTEAQIVELQTQLRQLQETIAILSQNTTTPVEPTASETVPVTTQLTIEATATETVTSIPDASVTTDAAVTAISTSQIVSSPPITSEAGSSVTETPTPITSNTSSVQATNSTAAAAVSDSFQPLL
jgi:hypothetical protein